MVQVMLLGVLVWQSVPMGGLGIAAGFYSGLADDLEDARARDEFEDAPSTRCVRYAFPWGAGVGECWADEAEELVQSVVASVLDAAAEADFEALRGRRRHRQRPQPKQKAEARPALADDM